MIPLAESFGSWKEARIKFLNMALELYTDLIYELRICRNASVKVLGYKHN